MAAVNMNSHDFNRIVLEEKKTVLLDFWAPWCGYCRRIGPAYEMIAEENPQLVVAKVNIDEEPQIAEKLKIEVIPTILLFKDGQVVSSIVAPESKSKIQELLDQGQED